MSAPWPVREGAYKKMDGTFEKLPLVITRGPIPPKLNLQLITNVCNNFLFEI